MGFLLHEPVNQCEAQMVNGEERKAQYLFSLISKECCCHWEVGLSSEM